MRFIPAILMAVTIGAIGGLTFMALQNSNEMRIISPGSGSQHPKGVPFDVLVSQEELRNPDPSQGVACGQFSPDGEQWTTCRPHGEAGAITCNVIPWSGQGNEFTLSVAVQTSAYFRAGVWPDQSLTGPPSYYSQAVEYLKGPSGQVADPEPRA